MWKVMGLLLTISLCSSFSLAKEDKFPRTPSPKEAAVYIISPKNGASLSSPVSIQFGLKNMGVAPAGVKQLDTGHHHLIINGNLPPLDKPIPNSDVYRHFGKGQTELSLELPPGKHTLQLILGDYVHIPHDPPVVSEKITINVKK